MKSKEILALLPYQEPFLFVDEILSVSADSIVGTYTYDKTLPFYQGHFKKNPVTPGVILTETMAQIGLVSLGIYLISSETESTVQNKEAIEIAFTSADVNFFLPVYPGEKVTVKSEKQYFRFNKLKCKVQLFNDQEELVCRGTLTGMMKK